MDEWFEELLQQGPRPKCAKPLVFHFIGSVKYWQIKRDTIHATKPVWFAFFV